MIQYFSTHFNVSNYEVVFCEHDNPRIIDELFSASRLSIYQTLCDNGKGGS